MTNKHLRIGAILLGASVFLSAGAIDIVLVPVGDAGNDADTDFNANRNGRGSVAYEYQIGKYEVTNAHYAAFLNAVGVTDTSDIYGLYVSMTSQISDYSGIEWNGTAGEFQAKTGRADWPVNYVSFYDAARFCNWLTNGQKETKVQDATTTESGLYVFSDATTMTGIADRTKVTGWALPSEDEWYKAAYYNPDDQIYRQYPVTGALSSSVANYYLSMPAGNYFASVGYFDNTPGAVSSYGTFQQGGNVAEWNDTVVNTDNRVVRGGGFGGSNSYLDASGPTDFAPSGDAASRGFRVVYLTAVPEPQTYALFGGMALLGLTILRRRNK